MMRWLTTLLLLAAPPMPAGGAEALPPPAARPVPAPADALARAAEDAAKLSRETTDALPFVRWVFCRDKDELWAASYALNSVSRASIPHKPYTLRGGYLARIDLRDYFPKDADLAEVLELWERLQNDPAFSYLVTGDTLRLLSDEQKSTKVKSTRPAGQIKKKVAPYRADDGRTYDWVWEAVPAGAVEVELRDAKDIVLVRLNAFDPAQRQLQEAVRSQAPVVTAEYLTQRLLSQVQDAGPFKEVFGGLYYDFAGIKRSKEKGVTDLDLFFIAQGIGAKGEGFRQVLARVGSEQRVAVFKSKVTGKPRRVYFFLTPAGFAGEAPGWTFITEDIRNQDIAPEQHAMMNLRAGKFAAFEVITVQRNGFLRYAVFTAAGALLDEVDSKEVVADSTVPHPFTPRLQPAISCIRCHGAAGGWQPLRNDVKTALKAREAGVDVFGDVSDAGLSIKEVLDELAGQYAGSPDGALARARDDLAKAVLRAADTRGRDDPAGEGAVSLASAAAARVYAAALYRDVGPAEALRDLGWVFPSGQERRAISSLLLPDPRAQVGGIMPEDIRLYALRAKGLQITAIDWAFVRSFAASRARYRISQLQQARTKP